MLKIKKIMVSKVKNRKPELSDRVRISRISGAVFRGNAETAECFEKADLNQSLVATVDGIVIGVYLIGNRQVLDFIRESQRRRIKLSICENLTMYDLREGVECLLLATLSKYRNLGIGKHLIEHPSTLGKDYVWGLSGKCFKALPYWLKRRRLVAETLSDYVTIQDFH